MSGYEIPIPQHRPDEVISFCYTAVLEHWPQAVLVSDRQVYPRTAGRPYFPITHGEFYKDRDRYTAARLFSNTRHSLQFEIRQQMFHFDGDGEGGQIAQSLAVLPFWKHRVSSRLAAVDG